MRRAAAGLALALAGCAAAPDPAEPPPYRPTHREYAAFAAAWPDLLEPNYLPFMLHRAARSGPAGDVLFFCRWADADMPLAVHVAEPAIPEALQHEFAPREPARYVDAVERALDTWERALEGLVRFRRVASGGEARLEIRLLAEPAPEPVPELRVFGATRLGSACRVHGRDPHAERLEVSFQVPELRLFLADEFGLLAPGQLEWIALHEIGHALGMRGHSPIPADLMYEIARDRASVNEGLSLEDVNSFVSLYRLPNGTLFGRVSPEPAPAPAAAPGPPRLAIAPYVDARLGFEFRPPAGWTRVPTARGMVAVHGVTWDYSASFQIVVQRFATIEAYLQRYGGYYGRRGRLTRPAPLVVNGRRALRFEIAVFDEPNREQITLVEVGDGRLLVIIADAAPEAFDAYRPWFQQTLASLEITDLPEEAWPGGRRRPGR